LLHWDVAQRVQVHVITGALGTRGVGVLRECADPLVLLVPLVLEGTAGTKGTSGFCGFLERTCARDPRRTRSGSVGPTTT